MNNTIKEAAMNNAQLSDSLRELERVVPPTFASFLQQHKNIALVLERDPQSRKIRIGVKKIHSSAVKRILRESKQDLAAKEEAGYSKKDATKDFSEAQDEIAAYSRQNAR